MKINLYFALIVCCMIHDINGMNELSFNTVADAVDHLNKNENDWERTERNEFKEVLFEYYSPEQRLEFDIRYRGRKIGNIVPETYMYDNGSIDWEELLDDYKESKIFYGNLRTYGSLCPIAVMVLSKTLVEGYSYDPFYQDSIKKCSMAMFMPLGLFLTWCFDREDMYADIITRIEEFNKQKPHRD